MTAELIMAIIKGKVSSDIPVVFGVDFGHVYPMISFPVGGTIKLSAYGNNINIMITEH